MSFARIHKLVTYGIAGLGLFALTLGDELSPLFVGLMAVGFVASFFVEEPLVSRPLWTKAFTAAGLVVMVAQVVRAFYGESALVLGIEYAAFLQITRLFNRKTAREHQQIAVLAFLHLVAATVLSTDVTYGLVFFGFVVFAPWMLAISHLRREVEGNYPKAPDEAASAPASADVRRVLASRRVVSGRFLAGTALLAVPLFAMTGLLFLVFPRVGVGMLSFGKGHGPRVTGFGNEIELGGFGTIRDDPTVVVRVKPVRGGVDRPLRLRGTSFDLYDGRRWTRSVERMYPLPPMFQYYPVARWPQVSDEQRYDIVLEPLDEPVIFLPRGTIGLDVPPRVRRGREIPERIARGLGLELRYVDGGALGLRYSAIVAREGEPALIEPLEDEERALYLRMPDGHGRVVELARRVAGNAASDRARVLGLLSYLRDEGRYRYTLEQPNTGDALPLEVFLFDARAGHCEYFSTALAVMLRAIGIPARNVTGFVGGRFNRYGEYWALRQGDAHSWVEAYVEGRWVTLDPTPPARAAMGPEDEGTFATMRAFFDALRVRWSANVVGYDLRAQSSAVSRFVDWMRARRRAERGLRSHGPDADEGAHAWRSPGAAFGELTLPLTLVVLLLLGWFIHVRGRRSSAGDLPRQAAEAVELYRALDRALAKRGHGRPTTATPREHARALESAGFPAARIVRDVTEAYERARFGGHVLDPAEVARLRAAIRELAERPR